MIKYHKADGTETLKTAYTYAEQGRATSMAYRGEAGKPDTLNLYTYCANNPINYVDHSVNFV